MQIFSSAKAINLTHVDMIQYFNKRGDKMLLRKSIQNPDFYHRVRAIQKILMDNDIYSFFIYFIFTIMKVTPFLFLKRCSNNLP